MVADIGIRLVREDFFLATPEEMVFPRSGLSLQSSQVTMMTPGEAESVSKNGQTIPDVAQEIALRSQRLVRVLGKHSLVTDGYRTYFMEEGSIPRSCFLGRGRAARNKSPSRSKNPPSGSRLRCRRADFVCSGRIPGRKSGIRGNGIKGIYFPVDETGMNIHSCYLGRHL